MRELASFISLVLIGTFFKSSYSAPDGTELITTNWEEVKLNELLKIEGTRRDGSIYTYFLSNFQATFDEAAQYCADVRSQLVIIKTDVKQAEVRNLLISYSVYDIRWINIRYFSRWVWGDNSDVNYNNFVYSVDASTQRGVIVPANDFMWFTDSMNAKHKFVCEPFF